MLAIANSTFFANSAQGGSGSGGYIFTDDFPGGELGGAGGDATAGAASLGNEPITISNSTFSANTALGGSGGPGGFDVNTAAGTRTQGTGGAAGNGQTGGILAAGAATLNNTIVAGSTGDVTVSSGALAGGHNLIQDGSGGLADTITGDPVLGSLADNGGPTLTLALPDGSPAVRRGSVALIPAGVTADQRGLPRTVSNTVDIGAFEDQNSAPSPTFSALASQSIVYGTAATTLTGNIGSDGSFPTGSSVSITLNSVAQTALVDGSGNFTTTFDTSSLGVGSGPYTVTYAFAGGRELRRRHRHKHDRDCRQSGRDDCGHAVQPDV